MQLASGTAVGPYEIVSLLGAGGMGEVYEATDRRLGRRVAVKVLSARSVARSEALERFQREARAVAALSHPNVVTLFDIGSDGDLHYVVTELLEGDTLRAHLDRPLDVGRALDIITAVCDGLAAAHEKKIVHRDLKPENIFLTTGGGVKILDFGLARLDEMLAGEPDSTATVLKTPDGVVLGTVAYMAPEQVRGETADAAADVFALGCILHEMITGERPFGRATAAETMHAILKDPPARVPGRRTRLLRNLDALLGECLDKNPLARPRNATEVAARLRALGSTSSGRSRRDTPAAAPRTVVAVLPFSAASPEEEGLGALVADAIRTRLVENPKIRVIARSAVQRFRAPDADPQEAGREVGATLVIGGEVRRIGESRHLHVELMEVADAAQIWGERYVIRDSPERGAERAADDVVRSLQPHLGSDVRPRAKKQKSGGTSESLQLVSAARAQLDTGAPEGIQRAAALLRESVTTETGGAAWTLLAESELALAAQGLEPPAAPRDRAIDAAERALAADGRNADALATTAGVRTFFLWDTDAAERLARAAIAEDPAHPLAHLRLSEALLQTGRRDQAIEHLGAALAIDPSPPLLMASCAWIAHLAGEQAKAIELCHRAIVLSPDALRARAVLTLALAASGNAVDAVQEIQRGDRAHFGETEAALGFAYAVAGKRAGARKIADRLGAPGRPHYTPPYLVARIVAALGEYAAAAELLERAVAEGSPYVVWLEVDPAFTAIRERAEIVRTIRRVRAGYLSPS